MERVIHKYFDKMEALEDKVSIDVDTIVADIDIKAIMKNPQEELTAVVSILFEKLEEEYHVQVFNLGKKFVKDINET